MSGHYRMNHKPFVVVQLSGDIEPSFDDFDTYEEALAFIENGEGARAWIVGPEWTEDHS